MARCRAVIKGKVCGQGQDALDHTHDAFDPAESHKFEPEDAAPAPKRDAYDVALEREEFGDYRGKTSPQAEKGGDPTEQSSSAIQASNHGRTVTPATRDEAGARVAGHGMPMNYEPVAQPSAGGEAPEADVRRVQLAQQARAERDAAKMLNMDVDELRKVQGQLRDDHHVPIMSMREIIEAEEPAAGQSGAEQWLITKGYDPVSAEAIVADVEAYAAHVTKGLEAERNLWRKSFNDACNQIKSLHELREAAEARNVELMGELERARKEQK